MNKIEEKELKQLFDEIKNDNKVAFEKFYLKYKNLVYGIAFSILKNEADAEDMVQIVFTKIFEMEKNKLPNNKEACWIYSLTKNETISLLRRKKKNIDLEDIYKIEDSNNEINKIIDKNTYNNLISKLNDKEKEIVSLKILAKLSFNEIGQVLNEPVGTIKWRYYKSIHTLKILLSNLGMFIIMFVIGLKTLSNNKKSSDSAEIIIKDESITQNITNQAGASESLEQETNKNFDSIAGDEEKNIIEEETIIIDDYQEDNTNYFGIGILSISVIFFIITIIFLIKYQLKFKKKTSK